MAKHIDHRNRRVPCIVGLVVLAAACLGWQWGQSFRIPRLVVSDVDMGNYIPGQKVQRVIRLENQGRGSLVVNEVKSCCGVSVVGGVPKKIPAASSDVIILQIRAPDDPLPFERSVVLHTNDPTNPARRVFVRGVPDLPVYVSPRSIDLKHVLVGEQVANAAMIMIPDNKQVTFSLTSSSPNVHACFPEEVLVTRLHDRDYGMFEMEVSVGEGTPRGPLREYLLLKTGLERRPYVVIPVTGVVERGVRVRPEQVFFGTVRGRSVASRVVRLEVVGPGWDTIRIEPPDCSGVTATLQQNGEHTFELHVFLDPTRMPAKLRSDITLEASSGDTITIPILAARQTLQPAV